MLLALVGEDFAVVCDVVVVVAAEGDVHGDHGGDLHLDESERGLELVGGAVVVDGGQAFDQV